MIEQRILTSCYPDDLVNTRLLVQQKILQVYDTVIQCTIDPWQDVVIFETTFGSCLGTLTDGFTVHLDVRADDLLFFYSSEPAGANHRVTIPFDTFRATMKIPGARIRILPIHKEEEAR